MENSPDSPAILSIRLFGRPEFRFGPRLLPRLATVKTQSLLAFLIFHCDRPHSRDELAARFWGDRADRPARRALATALWRIRRMLGDDEYLIADASSIQFNPASGFWLDVAEFEKLATTQPPSIDLMHSAVDLYRGDLLEGFYDDWCVEERYRLEELYLLVLRTAVSAHMASDQPKEALRFAELVLARDPLREDMHRAAIQLHMHMGDRGEAVRHARWCRSVLEAELSTEPTPETIALCDNLLGPTWRREPVGERPLPASRSRENQTGRLLEHPPFVGREPETRTLLEFWSEAISRRGRLVCVSGEAGIGKSRLVEEVSQRVRQRGGWVVEGHCYEYERALPHAPLADILRSVLLTGGPGVLTCLSSWQIAELAHLAPELGDQVQLPRERIIPVELEQTRLFNAMSSLLLDLSRRNPLLLVLEDIHWAHDSTLAWLHYMARHLRDASILLMTTCRREEMSPEQTVSNLMAQMEQSGLARRVELDRLAHDSLAQWMPGASPERVTQIYQQTEGNPFFALETIRALAEAGQVHLDEGRWVETPEFADMPIPDSIRQLVRVRLDRLSPEASKVLEIAAVIGRTFDYDILERAWGQGEEPTLATLDELTRRRIIREGSGAFAKDYQFDHHLVREIVYRGLHHRRRQSLHHRIAIVLAQSDSDNLTDGEIAFHYTRAENWTKAQEYLLKAGDQAGSRAADVEALSLYQQALDVYRHSATNGWEPLQRAVLERKMGEIYFRRGEYARALENLSQALTLMGRTLPSTTWGVRRELLGQVAQQLAHRAFTRLLVRPPLQQPPEKVIEEITIYMPIGWIDTLLSCQEPYLLVSLRALNLSEQHGYAGGVACGATALGLAADLTGLFPIAGYLHRRALSALNQVNHAGIAGFSHMGLTYHAYLIGEEDSALDHAKHSSDAFQKAGDPHRWAMVNLMASYVHDHRGNLTQALDLAKELVSLGEQGGDLQVQCFGREMYGIVQRQFGQLDHAMEHLQQALAFAKQVPDYMSWVEISGELAKCFLQLGDLPQALSTLQAAEQIAVQHQVSGDSLGRFLNSQAEAYLAAAEQFKDDWLKKAGKACQAARRQCRAYRPGMPEALRLAGTYDWLRGDHGAAQATWQRSLELAQTLGHSYDKGLVHLEMGRRIGESSHLERAEQIRQEIGAAWGKAQE